MYRRTFLRNIVGASASACFAGALSPARQFKLGAISDGFSQDFEQALQAMRNYGLHWVEIRKMFGVYNTEATGSQVQQIKTLLDRYGFRVSVIDSALFKCTLPGTKPISGQTDAYPYDKQMDLLQRACDRAHSLGANKIRIFTFWRVAEPAKIAGQIAEELEKAAEVASRSGMRLVVENEETCNAGTGHELSKTLARAPAANLGANWDVGNGYMLREVSYPDGYRALDKKRIWHMHLKGMTCKAQLQSCSETVAGEGQIDLVGQFKALLQDGYNETMSLECEYEAPGLTHLETTKKSLEAVLRTMATAAEASTS